MSQTVIGFFDDQSDAQRAVERLQSSGISRDRVDVSRGSAAGSAGNAHLDTSNTSSDRISGDTPNPVSGSTRDENSVRRDNEGRTLDPNDRNTNVFTDFFNNLFGGRDKDDDNDDAGRYSHVAQRSGAIVTVHAQSREEAENAAEILDECGAVDVDEKAEQYGYANTRSEGLGERQNTGSEREQSIPVINENLEVGKRMEERGGVRVRSRIVERPVEEHIRLREEHVHVEREPVNRPVSDADMRNLQDRDIELTERAEVPVVNKEARVVEEVRISKNVEERDETVRDTLRNTEVDVDRSGSGTTGRSSDLNNDNDLDDDISRRNKGL